MLKLVRVDHRLLHGQVVFKWSKMLDIDCILIADDQVAKDDLRMSALRLAKPEACKLVIKSVDDSVKALNSQVTDKYKLLVITETIEDAYRLAKQVPQIKYINLGGTRMMEGRRQISKAIFVSEKDIEMLKELNSSGVQTRIQMVPDDVPEDASRLI
jgi:fructoselysine and glucoselysine-specific PTS system IIB component